MLARLSILPLALAAAADLLTFSLVPAAAQQLDQSWLASHYGPAALLAGKVTAIGMACLLVFICEAISIVWLRRLMLAVSAAAFLAVAAAWAWGANQNLAWLR